MNMALLIFAFVKNGYLLRLASTLQQNWPHSFRKMSFDVWRIFLYFSQITVLARFASNGGTFWHIYFALWEIWGVLRHYNIHGVGRGGGRTCYNTKIWRKINQQNKKGYSDKRKTLGSSRSLAFSRLKLVKILEVVCYDCCIKVQNGSFSSKKWAIIWRITVGPRFWVAWKMYHRVLFADYNQIDCQIVTIYWQ